MKRGGRSPRRLLRATSNGGPSRSRLVALATAALMASPFAAGAQSEDLRVLDEARGPWMAFTDAPNDLYRRLHADVTERMAERADEVAEIAGETEWSARRDMVRTTLQEALGPFSQRTPLAARTTGTFDHGGVRVELVIFESSPGVPVTGALFLPPDAAAPAPAVLYLSGHNILAFRTPGYQRVILDLAQQGFVVLAIDPIAQGERLEYGIPEMGLVDPGLANTRGHSYVGAQLFLTGGSLAADMTWDAIRALDYLAERPEVDASRLAVTGRSGGGTQAAYLAALDDRVSVAAIENYVTSNTRLWETRGPQDAEQHLAGVLAQGIDHADLLLARAPRRTLVIATTRDIFSIQGTREAVVEARRAYADLGAPDELRLVEDDAGHELTDANREALYGFLRESLDVPEPGSGVGGSLEPIPAARLQVTATGQMLTSLEPRTTFARNRERAEGLLAARRTAVARQGGAVEAARRVIGYREPDRPAEVMFMGRHRREGYTIEQHLLRGRAGELLPFLLMLPDSEVTAPLVLHLDPAGKAARAGVGGELERLVRSGHPVAMPDLAGFGELGPGDFTGDSSDFGERGTAPFGLWFGAAGIGRSIVAVHAEEVVCLLRHLLERPELAGFGVRGIGVAEFGSAILHAAAFEPRLERIAIVGSVASLHEVVTTRDYDPRWVIGGAAGMLATYDLPDLEHELGPERVARFGTVDAALAVGWEEADDDDLDDVPPPPTQAFPAALFEWIGEGADGW